ncbi:GNAT family N-acetyltransferase [Natronolimnobius baerhuensis]|uniref:GNAT family N-acetyltransferase n=1 Tax=Natronolimnobius baerhuensis TaxID=253108 RepID=A0A202EAP4_9EURY|nr:GNAT family N-acetyltransferase [Natronolimnobius baerhuensis]OVE85307.1 GNAT family N-acetyltransferase [Natronolimnobius baerhuensis]
MTDAVRRATTDDVLAIHETARESWHATYDDVLGSDTVDSVVDDWYALGDLESAIADASSRDDVEFVVVEPDKSTDDIITDSEGDVLTGLQRCRAFAHVVPWPEDPVVAYLARFYVRPDSWGEGVGTALLEHLETTLEDSFDRIRLAVLADNEVGISFAESVGFERVTIRETDLGDGLEEYVCEKSI